MSDENKLVANIKHEMARLPGLIEKYSKLAREWESMTDREWGSLRQDHYRRRTHCPPSREYEARRCREDVAACERYMREATELLAVWDAAKAKGERAMSDGLRFEWREGGDGTTQISDGIAFSVSATDLAWFVYVGSQSVCAGSAGTILKNQRAAESALLSIAAEINAAAGVPDVDQLLMALEITAACGSPKRVDMYDEKCVDGWRWEHPDGRTWTEVGNWGKPVPLHPLARAVIAKAKGETT